MCSMICAEIMPGLPILSARITTSSNSCTAGSTSTPSTPRRMVPFETSITDANLYQLWLNHQPEIHIWRYSGTQEKRTGADWEWWIGGGGHWLGARVQAKKLDEMGRRYSTLWKTDGGVRQIDRLTRCSDHWTACALLLLKRGPGHSCGLEEPVRKRPPRRVLWLHTGICRAGSPG